MIVVITSWAPVRALSKPMIPPHTAAGDDAGEQRQRDLHDARTVHAEPDVHRGHAAGEHLAGGADVEQAGAEADARRRAR